VSILRRDLAGNCLGVTMEPKVENLHVSMDLRIQLPESKCPCNRGSWRATASMSRWILAGRCQGQVVYITEGLDWFANCPVCALTCFYSCYSSSSDFARPKLNLKVYCDNTFSRTSIADELKSRKDPRLSVW